MHIKSFSFGFTAVFVLYKIFISRIPTSFALGIAFPLGIAIGVGAFALFINSLNDTFKIMYLTGSIIEPFKLKNSFNEDFAKKYKKEKTFGQKLIDNLVLALSILASFTESTIVFFSTVNVLRSLSLTLSSPSLFTSLNFSFYLIATVLTISVFVTFLSATASSIRKNFETKHAQVSNSEKAEKSLNDLEQTVTNAIDFGDEHTPTYVLKRFKIIKEKLTSPKVKTCINSSQFYN